MRLVPLRFAFAAILLIMAAVAHSQIVATADTVSFGTLLESEGPKSVRMYVSNASPDTLGILKVRPTCGCTAVDFLKTPIAPGDSAWIDLTYDPYRRPGRFEKAVKIYPTEGEMIRVPITGTVVASEETLKRVYPSDGGLLHLSETTFMPLLPLQAEEKTLYADVYNADDLPVWTLVESESEAVTSQTFPSPVPPGEKGMIGLYVDPLKEPRTGRIEYNLRLYTSHDPETLKTQEPTPLKIIIQK